MQKIVTPALRQLKWFLSSLERIGDSRDSPTPIMRQAANGVSVCVCVWLLHTSPATELATDQQLVHRCRAVECKVVCFSSQESDTREGKKKREKITRN